MMNWLAIILAFGVAVLLGAFLMKLLQRTRTAWTSRRRMWVAAMVLPAFILFAAVVGIVWTLLAGPGEGENMQDLAVAVTAFVGAFFAFIALIGGIVGASFAKRSGSE